MFLRSYIYNPPLWKLFLYNPPPPTHTHTHTHPRWFRWQQKCIRWQTRVTNYCGTFLSCGGGLCGSRFTICAWLRCYMGGPTPRRWWTPGSPLPHRPHSHSLWFSHQTLRILIVYQAQPPILVIFVSTEKKETSAFDLYSSKPAYNVLLLSCPVIWKIKLMLMSTKNGTTLNRIDVNRHCCEEWVYAWLSMMIFNMSHMEKEVNHVL